MAYKAGQRVELVSMEDDPDPVPVGTKGTVVFSNKVDFGGGDRFTQVHIDWDNGRSLMACIPPDRIRVIDVR